MKIHDMLRAATQGKEAADIVIIGKGASLDAVRTNALRDKIIINVNDSESIVQGDIGVFHHGWVLDRFDHIPPSCRLYVTDRTLSGRVEVFPARYARYDEESELFIERFFDEETLWLEHTAIISCLRVANETAKALDSRKRVFLLGFDFSLENGFSTRIENGLHGMDDAHVDHLVRLQESYLEKLLNERVRLNIDIVHIGTRPYSLFTVEAFNALLETAPAKVNSLVVVSPPAKKEQDVLVVAEITTNHFGDRERLKAMIRLTKEAGADYIKLQKRNVESFYKAETLSKPFKSPFGTTFREYRHGLELTKEDFEWVDSFCKKIGIGWFASILDEPSFEFIKQFNPALIKLPSTISEKKMYSQKVGAEWTNGLVISTGMTGLEYEDFIADSFKKAKEIYLLQCTSAYPTPENDVGIGVVRHYRDLSAKDSRIIPGFSSHDIGSLCSQMAVAAGAKMIEKHVKLGGVQWAHFDEVALDLSMNQFATFVADVRRAQRIVGSEIKKIFDSEHHKY
ncbi:MAG: N-acetylneuraminate synthase family protein [Thiothrix sp.]|uniref:N-acetylneuraminate synthase family protein n=1 Tax=Thiothrix sp. TaxID=1032 RepID=UPI002627F8E9|nr:N-acetylneuraminate synthase family protein [Thiothrix sp.]MDD5392921.1 N-acetylneuraminate synthase family protein [Thiothrix sp.]